MNAQVLYDWSDLAFGDKKPLKSLRATMIAPSRKLSPARWRQLVKTYLASGPVIIAVAKEAFVDGFEGQPQFALAQAADVLPLAQKVAGANSPHQLIVLSCFQREFIHALEKLAPRQAVFINGSWKHSFHLTPWFYTCVKLGLRYERVSPYANDAEAKQAAVELGAATETASPMPAPGIVVPEQAMPAALHAAARHSFDHAFQTGAILAEPSQGGARVLLATCNPVVPYQTFAWHHGPAREAAFSPPGDLNAYDTVHAEVELMLACARQGINPAGKTLYINLLPCPTCCRMIGRAGVAEVAYELDHSDGYAINMLGEFGIPVRRLGQASTA